MKNTLRALCFILLMLVPFGCTAAKKPEPQPQPKTIVVPDVSRVSFETIDFDQSPEIVQALAKNHQEKHFATWTSVNGKNYVLVSRQNLPVGKDIEITEIERRIPANDFDWVNVKLNYRNSLLEDKDRKDNEDRKPIVASFTLDRPVKALGFEMTREKEGQGPVPVAPAPQTTPQPAPNKSIEKGLKLDSPKPGEQVKGSISVSGTAVGMEGNVRVRIKDSSGLTLAEKPMPINGNKFSGTLSYSPPANPEKGTVEAFISGEGGVEKDTVSIPVTILPTTTNEPEPIGAP
ncbi:Gmad2 immunoglobulin-like domain-containing protein [Desulfotomaculum sp. 1211_IL3151]|uniref:Gmad2 immunoglobulin-like domain-containing protein n=1 Tax=Desulfotomaculum sp. 1211_IL3151 TaxID=3084055 RepID=UPI002FD89D63